MRLAEKRIKKARYYLVMKGQERRTNRKSYKQSDANAIFGLVAAFSILVFVVFYAMVTGDGLAASSAFTGLTAENERVCVPVASDVECACGRGNGPANTAGPVQVNNDGAGCEPFSR
jgi:hypothetical protein